MNFFQDELATLDFPAGRVKAVARSRVTPGSGKFSLKWNFLSIQKQTIDQWKVYLSYYGLYHVKYAFFIVED